MPAGSFSQLYLRHIYPPGTQIIRRCCVCAFQPPTSLAELWQHARRMVLTPTFPSFFYPTRRPPPRGELPPKRETSTQNSTRGKTRKWLKWQRRSEDVHWHPPPLPPSTDLILISLWRSPTREDWTCLWRTASPSWAERGSLLARCVSSEINSFIHVKSPWKLQKHLVRDPTAAAGSGRNRPQGLRDAVVMTCYNRVIHFFGGEVPT